MDGEKVKCYKCDGFGMIDQRPKRFLGIPMPGQFEGGSPCPACHGMGELDWIENAMGGKQPEPTSIYTMFDCTCSEPTVSIVNTEAMS